MSRAATEFRYEKLTWPEINDAIDLRKVCIVPCGAVEQHGHHLPLDVDIVCPTGIAHGAGRLIPGQLLVLPTVCYGYTGHVMDFPGTINNHFEHFIDHVLDITAPKDVLRYIVLKGSIAVDGMSLTVAGVTKQGFRIWIIPHTFEVTALRERKVGDAVNLEADMLGKYVEKFVSRKHSAK